MTTTNATLTIDIDEDEDLSTGNDSYNRLVLDPDERRVYVEQAHTANGRPLRLAYDQQYDHEALPSETSAPALIDELKVHSDALERICDLHSIEWSGSAGAKTGRLDTDRFGGAYVRALLQSVALSVTRSPGDPIPEDVSSILDEMKDGRTEGLKEQYL